MKWRSVEFDDERNWRDTRIGVGGIAVKIGVAAGKSVEGGVSLWYILEDGMERKGQVMETTMWKAEMKTTRRTYLKTFASGPCL